MKKLLILFVGLVMMIAGVYAQQSVPDGETKFYYPSGKLSSEGTIRNGKPDGYWKTYYENGNLKSEGNRKDFKLDGEWKFYTDSGKVKGILTYDAGKKNGVQKNFYENGVLSSEENVIQDVKEGWTNYYSEKGKLQKRVPFKGGVESACGYEYSPDGLITTIIEYKKGFVVREERINRSDKSGQKQGTWRTYFENEADSVWLSGGKVQTEGIYKDNKKQQLWKTFDVYGNVLKEEVYINGELADKDESQDVQKLDVKRQYYPGGKLKSVGSYNKDVPEGVFREYTADGKIYDAKIYKAGKLMREGVLGEDGLEQGPWKEFHESGAVKARGDYEKGKRTGVWKFYFENGNLEQEGNYKDGKADGEWKWYYVSKRLRRDEFYKNGRNEGEMHEYTDNDAASVDWNVIAEGKFMDGKREGEWTFHSDELVTKGNYYEGSEDGEWKQYYFDPGKKLEEMKISFSGSYTKGDEHGTHTYYYINGKPREVRSYKLGVRDGVWQRWDAEGNLIITTHYENGKEIRIDGTKLDQDARD